jgi:zinc protease
MTRRAVSGCRCLLRGFLAAAGLAFFAAGSVQGQPAPSTPNTSLGISDGKIIDGKIIDSKISDGKTAAGIRMVHVRMDDAKEQNLAFFWRDRHVLHNPDKVGMLVLATSLLMTGGSQALDGGALGEDLKDLGAGISMRRTMAFTLGELSAPNEAINETADLLKQVIATPRLPEKSLERAKRSAVGSVKAARERPAAIAERAMSALFVGDHVLGSVASFEPPTVITSVTTSDIDAWRKAVLARDNLVVVSAGRLTREESAALVDRIFGALPETAVIVPAIPFEPRHVARTIVIERPVEQSIILAGTTTRWNSANDGQSRSIAMNILGGGTSSRLFVAIREKLGAAYGAQAGISAMLGGHFQFSMQASVANEKVGPALAAMHGEHARFIRDGVTEAEVAPIKTRMLTSQAETMRRPGSAASAIRTALTLGMPFDSPDSFGDRLSKISAADISTLIKDRLKAQLTTIVVTPSAAALAGEGITVDCVIKSLDELKTCKLNP